MSGSCRLASRRFLSPFVLCVLAVSCADRAGAEKPPVTESKSDADSPASAVQSDRPGEPAPSFDPTRAVLKSIAELDVWQYDWPQWGGSGFRNNTPFGKNIPVDWSIGDYQYQYQYQYQYRSRWASPKIPRVPEGSCNIKWVVPLGTQTYGNPVVANGRIFVGTNNGSRYIGRFQDDLGVLLCFEEETGRFLWQHSNEKLPTGRVNDWPEQGVCSTPVVDGNRLWYVSNRGEVVCLDTKGFYDDEDDGVAHVKKELGKWVHVFEVPATLHRDMEELREEFANAGVTLAKDLHLGRWTTPWTLGRWQRKPGTREWVASWELRLRDGNLIAIELSTDTPPKPMREIFSKQDDLFPSLRDNKLDDRLRELIREQGIDVSPDHLNVHEAGVSWEFTGEVQRQSRLFRLTVTNGLLTISKQLGARERDEADVVWKFDMINELGVFPHNMSNCSMITANGMLFVCTSNGVDESHREIPSPHAPSFIALDRLTGKVLWQDNSPGNSILHAQWASPSYGVFDGQAQVIFPGGDGWVYSFDPNGDGTGQSRLLWKFDANPKESRWELGGRGTRNSIIAFPAICDGLVYIVVGQDPEHGQGHGHLWCIDPARRIDGSDVSDQIVVDETGTLITDRPKAARGLQKNERAVPNPDSAVRWHFTQQDTNGNGEIDGDVRFGRSLSTPVIKDDILYVADLTGFFYCLNAKTGKLHWRHDLFAACWGSALIVDGHVYMADEDGEVHIFRHSSDPKLAVMDDNTIQPGNGRILEVNSSIYMTPVVANNVLYVASKNSLFAIQAKPGSASDTK